MALVLVEQHAKVALELTEDAVAIGRGIMAHKGKARELLADSATLDRYIGLNLEA